MVNKATKLLSAIVLVFLSLYIVTLNSGSITLNLTSTRSFSMTAGIMFIIIFMTGFLVASLLAAIFRVRSLWYEKGLEKQEDKRQKFYRDMIRARSLLAAGEFTTATEAWKRIVKTDPTNVIAHIELSRCLEGSDQLQEALKELERTRATEASNIEVLFRAAELNLALNNKTAAIDNLALILSEQPCLRAARMARNLSEELGRPNDALEYQKQAEQLGESEEESRKIRERLLYTILAEELTEEEADDKRKQKQIEAFLRRHPESVGALTDLAHLCHGQGDIDKAAQLLVRAAHSADNLQYWKDAVRLWLHHDMADNAIGAARTATRKTRGQERLRAELELIKVYLVVNDLDKALTHINTFAQVARKNECEITPGIAQTLYILKGLCHNQRGEPRDAAQVWKELAGLDNIEPELPVSKLDSPPKRLEALGPQYSTP